MIFIMIFSWSLFASDIKIEYLENTTKEIKRGSWSLEEDAKLLDLVDRFGTNHWNRHACYMNRNARQIRERWVNHLASDLKKGRFTEQELIDICKLRDKYFMEYGENKWALIANHFPGRTDNQIKNAWYGKSANNIKKKFVIDKNNKELKSKRKKNDCNAYKRSAKKNKILQEEYPDNLATKYNELLDEHKNLQDSYFRLLEQYQASNINSNKIARCPLCTCEFNPHAFADFDNLVECALDLNQCLHM